MFRFLCVLSQKDLKELRDTFIKMMLSYLRSNFHLRIQNDWWNYIFWLSKLYNIYFLTLCSWWHDEDVSMSFSMLPSLFVLQLAITWQWALIADNTFYQPPLHCVAINTQEICELGVGILFWIQEIIIHHEDYLHKTSHKLHRHLHPPYLQAPPFCSSIMFARYCAILPG